MRKTCLNTATMKDGSVQWLEVNPLFDMVKSCIFTER